MYVDRNCEIRFISMRNNADGETILDNTPNLQYLITFDHLRSFPRKKTTTTKQNIKHDDKMNYGGKIDILKQSRSRNRKI